MKFSIERSQLEKVFAQRNGYMLLALGSLLICFVQIMVIVFLIGREKIILVPPTIEKSFWVSAQHVSPDYLAEMTTFFAALRLNLTQESAQTQRDVLLRYADPVSYNALKSQLIQEADHISEQNMSLAFFPIADVKTDMKHFKAIIEGDLKSYMGDALVSSVRTRYLVTYHYHAGRLFIKSFEEMKHV